MKALILGFIVIIAATLLVLPIGLGWAEDVISFLRGSLPVVSVFIGLILIFVGITDVKERTGKKESIQQKETK